MDECIVDVKDQKAQLLKVSLWLLSCRGTKNPTQTWIANEDNAVEGKWTNWYTGEVKLITSCLFLDTSLWFDLLNQPLEYAPWADARPYDGGFRYNCMMLQVQIAPRKFYFPLL